MTTKKQTLTRKEFSTALIEMGYDCNGDIDYARILNDIICARRALAKDALTRGSHCVYERLYNSSNIAYNILDAKGYYNFD